MRDVALRSHERASGGVKTTSDGGRAKGREPPTSLTALQRSMQPPASLTALQREMQPPASLVEQQQKMQSPAADLGARIRARAGQGQPLQLAVQRRLERGLAADLSRVRVHTDSEADHLARAVDAAAFTTGPNIFFRRGAYRPHTRAGLRLLAHEATHATQQAAGPVAGTEAPGGVSLSDPADRFERAASAAAARVVGGAEPATSSVGATASPAASAPAEGAVPVQRNIGLELESEVGAAWSAWTEPGPFARSKPVPKGTPLIHREHFQLQAEFAGDDLSNIEFVTNSPGLIDKAEFEACRDGLVELGDELNAERGRGFFAFNAANLKGGDPRYKIKGAKPLTAHLQVTVGVPLASVQALFEKLGGTFTFVNKVANRAVARAQEALHLDEASEELHGFISMLQQYLIMGANAENRAFPKSLFSVLAKTDFHKMFTMLPEAEQTAIATNMQGWLTAVLIAGAADPQPLAGGEPLAKQVFDDPQSAAKAVKLATTRSQWLSEMPERDILTYKGLLSVPDGDHEERAPLRREALKASRDVRVVTGKKTPDGAPPPHGYQDPRAMRVPEEAADIRKLIADLKDLYQGIGSLGRATDTIRYESAEHDTAAAIVEIRDPGPLGAVSNWATKLNQVYKMVEEAIADPLGKSGRDLPTGAHRSVLSDRGAAQRAVDKRLREDLETLRNKWFVRNRKAKAARIAAAARTT